MTLAISLQKAARSLITTFGNTTAIYTYSTATKAENAEGDITVSSWGTASAAIAVDGQNAVNILAQVKQGKETLGEDDKIFRDDATIAVNDRITINSQEFRVNDIALVRTQDTLIIQIVNVTRVTSTTVW